MVFWFLLFLPVFLFLGLSTPEPRPASIPLTPLGLDPDFRQFLLYLALETFVKPSSPFAIENPLYTRIYSFLYFGLGFCIFVFVRVSWIYGTRPVFCNLSIRLVFTRSIEKIWYVTCFQLSTVIFLVSTVVNGALSAFHSKH